MGYAGFLIESKGSGVELRQAGRTNRSSETNHAASGTPHQSNLLFIRNNPYRLAGTPDHSNLLLLSNCPSHHLRLETRALSLVPAPEYSPASVLVGPGV